MYAASNVDPVGRVRYTAYASGFAYLQAGGGVARPSAARAAVIEQYVTKGRVVDEAGKAIEGVALRIGGELVFTDSQGNFSLRCRQAKEYLLEIVVEEFMYPGAYEVVSAPARVKAARDEGAENYLVILRRKR